jgi:protein-disulfide isomerase
MRTKSVAILSGLIAAGLLAASPGIAQSSDDTQGLKKEIQALKEGQQAIQKDLQEIKKLIAARPAGGGTDPALFAQVSVDGEPFRGDKDAKLTLIEFSEFQCPFCGRHVKDTYPTIEKEYIQTGKVKYVFRDLPLEAIHKNAFKAAEAAHCAGDQKKFWEMHDRLFENQKALTPTDLTAHAQAIGLDAGKFQQCLDSGKFAADIRKDIADANKIGINGTPTTVIGVTQPNDSKIKVLHVIKGAQSLATFKEALDRVAAENIPGAKKEEKKEEKKTEKPVAGTAQAGIN